MLVVVDGVCNLCLGTLQAALDGLLILGAAATQTALELLHIRGQHKDGRCTGVHLLDVACALDLDDEDDRDAQLHAALDLAAQRAVVVLAVFCVLDDLVMCQMILKIGYRHEVVIDAVLFTLTRGAGRGGDGVLNFRVLFQQSGNNGILAGAGRAGDNKQIFFTFHRYFLFSSVSSLARPVRLSSGMPDKITWSESMMSTAWVRRP